MKHLLAPLAFGLCTIVSAQTLTLDTAIAQAVRHERYAEETGEIAQSGALRIRESGNSWYPTLALNATSTYQNKQVEFPGAGVPGARVPEVPLNFNRVLLNFNQTLYEGGTTRSHRTLDELEQAQQQLSVEGRVLDTRRQVTQRFMTVLLAERQLELLATKERTLTEQMERMRTAVDAGAAIASDRDVLDAEIISTHQEMTEVRHVKERLRNELFVLMADERAHDAQFIAPEPADESAGSLVMRPDLRAYGLRMQALGVQQDMLRGSRLPTVRIFGNAGLGDPGYNYLDPDPRPMLLAGVSVDWRILDWGGRKRQDRILDLQRSLLDKERQRLEEHWSMALEQQRNEMLKYHELLEQDSALVTLRANIAKAKAEQLSLGTITSSDYITELDKENAARLGSTLHHLQLLLAQRDHLDIQGR